MKKVFVLISAISMAVVLSACTTTNSSDGGSMNIYPRTVGPVDSYRPIYSVNEKVRVSGEANVNVLFGIFTWGDGSQFADNASIFKADSFFGRLLAIFPNSKNIASKAAFYRACKSGKCDTVVAARYEVNTVDYFVFQKMNIKISGFPAKVVSLEIVKPMFYYVDPQGKITVLDKMVEPYCLFNLYNPPKTYWIF